MTQLDNVLLNVSDENFPTANNLDFSVFGRDNAVQVVSSQPVNKTPYGIFNLDAYRSTKPQKESCSDFDKLLASVEGDGVQSAQLNEARQWVSKTFYAEEQNLASLRLAAGLSQKQMGKICNIDQSHVSRYESGKHEPSLTISACMAKALGVDLGLFFIAWNNTRQLLQKESS